MIRVRLSPFLAALGLILAFVGSAFGQEADSSAILQASPDTVLTKTTDLDTTITYSAKNIEFFVDRKHMLLSGNAKIHYKAMTLRAEKIAVDWDENLVTAEGVADTIWQDSLRTVVDSVTIKGQPKFSEGDQEITGARMTYNLKSRRGRITEGETKYLDGYYWGEALKKDTSQVLYAGPGRFTTCSNKDPHYSFRSQEMKLIVNDKAVAKPVVLYFKDVPVAAIPFGVFPSRTGRQSGLIIPTYGESAVQGRFLHHLGYYYAPSDYYDVAGTLDYYERTGFLFNGNARYNWRYHLSGYMQGAITRQHLEEGRKRRWEVRLGHDQTIDPNTRLKVDANFVSDKSYLQQYSFNLNDQLTQTLRSDATLTHQFPGGKNSVSINLHHEQNLQNDEITQKIPSVQFRRGTSNIFPLAKAAPGDTSRPESKWYNNITYSYTGEYLHHRALDQVIAGGGYFAGSGPPFGGKTLFRLEQPAERQLF